MLPFDFFAIRRWLRELKEVMHDRRKTLALLKRARAAGAPHDAKAGIIFRLGKHSGGEVIDALGDVLARDPDWQARAAATAVLGGMNDATARELLDATAQHDSHPRVRERATWNRANPGAFSRWY